MAKSKQRRVSAPHAYGKMLWDYHHGKPAIEILERDDGHVRAAGPGGGPSLYFQPYEKWSAIEKKAMRHIHGRVLDIGCGAARHSLYLQKKGHSVLGIDSSPLAIEVSRLRGLKKGRVLSIRSLNRLPGGTFDTVILLGNNLGLLGSFRRARSVLKQLHSITSAGAHIIAETTDPHQTLDPLHLSYHARNRARGRMPGQMRMCVRYQTLVGPWMDFLFLSEEELQDVVGGTGWLVSRFIRSRNGSAHYVAGLEKQPPAVPASKPR